jgi:hypothetical protein
MSDLLAMLPALPGDIPHLVACSAELFVLHPRPRKQKPEREPHAGCADGETERILLRGVTDPPDLRTIRDRLRQLRRHCVFLVADVVTHAGADIGLVTDRVDLLAHTRAGLL